MNIETFNDYLNLKWSTFYKTFDLFVPKVQNK